ncbi:hypothetical protein OIU85_007760 [Salix viminalis]|uniref:F-BOX/RNI/FBD-LIKE DOMAIN PROTEIN n=2 Tax=Salix TaxID=40685 RepID=A0A9Q0US12_SALPP|nr:hypothetical protein OIU85_007760 [Salix viminalis]KAJ6735320.1 F-BOX/RNI/FBD-LIKE DOMAIN PROTEIN [Salix purpurea]
MNTGSLNAADRISQLPDDIIYLILSFLSTPEVVRLSVLSREWRQACATFPLSEFYSPSFADYFDGGCFIFVIFVYKSLLRQCLQYRNIPKFQFSFTKELCRPYVYSEHLPLPWDLDRLITRSIELGTHNGVKELSIHFSIPGYYKLPEAMLSVKELVVCSLGGCIFNGAAINWPSLRELSLNNVQFSDQRFIDNLFLTCPLIEEFALVECSGLKYLQLSGLRKLKKVTVKSGYSHLEKIEIDVVSLHTFSYYEIRNLKTDIDLTSCKNLEVFKLNVHSITEELIQHVNSNFPALKVLVLHGYSLLLHRIKISIPLLEKLKIIVSHMSVEEAIINTPRLRSFKCVMHKIGQSFFSLNQTSLQEVTFELLAAFNYIKHGENFEVFRGYLKNFNQIKLVNLIICVHSSSVIHKIVRRPVSNSGLLDIIHVKLEVFTRERESHALINDLFRISRPRSLSLVSGCGKNDEFMTILCKKLLRMEKRKQDGAATYQNCWQHELEGVKIQICGRNGSYNKVLTCDVFFDSLQELEPKQKIRFLFEW